MLVAYNQQGDLVNVVDTLPEKKEESYFCPGCNAPVRLKNGAILRPHFAHISLKECQYFSENESAQHLLLKSVLYRWLQRETQVVLEKRLSSINQIADILVKNQLALEIQCSSLPIQRLRERTQAYQGAGYVVLWLLGKNLWLKKRLSSLQQQFLYFSQQLGFYLWELDSERDEIRLRYLIHEDLHGNVQCLTKTFPFERGSLLEIFRLPFSTKKIQFFQGKMDQAICHYIAKQLYYRNKKWLNYQSEAYQRGENLLLSSADAFFPQLKPIQSQQGFVQIRQDLSDYYESFMNFYKHQTDKTYQIVYSPALYQKYLEKSDFQ